jgi:glycerate kinase
MRILIAPDKFKGSLSARQVAEHIALGIRDVIPDAQIEIAPVADGGEGTAEVICKARGGEWVTCHTEDGVRKARVSGNGEWIVYECGHDLCIVSSKGGSPRKLAIG